MVEGAGDPVYVAGFVRGLARSIGDRALEEAAVAASGDGGRQLLSAVIAERLTGLQPV